MVNQEVSDAYLHSDTSSTALGLPGIPVFLQTTRLLEEDQRSEIKELLEVYRTHRQALFEALVFPIGSEPNNAEWSGFQWVNPESREGYALVFRERLNEETTRLIGLRVMALHQRVRVADLRAGTSVEQTLDSEGRLRLSLADSGHILFLQITPL